MAGYLGAIPVPQATQHRESFTATSGQTTFNTAGYTVGFLDVYLNGSHLSPADFTATNGSDVVLASGASADDVCDIISYTAFEVNSQTFTGTTTLDGAVVINESSADVDFRVESNGNANMLFVDGGNNAVGIGTGSPTVLLDLEGISPVIRLTDSDATGTPESQISGAGGDLIFDADRDNEKSSTLIKFNVDGSEAMRIDSSGNVGIGEVPSAWLSAYTALQIGGAGNVVGSTDNSFVAVGANAYLDSTNSRYEYINTDYATQYYQVDGTHVWRTAASGSADAAITWSEAMRIASSGDLLVGTASDYAENVQAAFYGASNGGISLASGTSGLSRLMFADGVAGTAGAYVGSIIYSHADNSMRFNVNGGTERMRIDSSGNLLVGKTSPSGSTVGAEMRSAGTVIATVANDYPLYLNRTSSDGDIAKFNKDGSTVGSIGFVSTGAYIQGETDHSGFRLGGSQIVPFRNGSDTDNTTDLGASGTRFDDIFATNGTIQTSDRNEKQDIAALTSAEMLVGKRISALFKTFRWKDKVAAKGNDARTHTGIIAQDVQSAFTAESLDAGDYSLFISTTWWEHDVEVPAVEAVAEVTEDVVIAAVEEELDEEGNVLVEAQEERTEQRLITEAVEAVDAYTRTDTYDTEDEAPEGATSRTRLGIRYPELLSFVAAYNEQRFASIETRLTALEG